MNALWHKQLISVIIIGIIGDDNVCLRCIDA